MLAYAKICATELTQKFDGGLRHNLKQAAAERSDALLQPLRLGQLIQRIGLCILPLVAFCHCLLGAAAHQLDLTRPPLCLLLP